MNLFDPESVTSEVKKIVRKDIEDALQIVIESASAEVLKQLQEIPEILSVKGDGSLDLPEKHMDLLRRLDSGSLRMPRLQTLSKITSFYNKAISDALRN